MSNFDSLSEFKGGLIQHGRYNDRIYLMRQPETVSKIFIESLIDFATEKKYSKIFAKSRLEDCSKYLDMGFISEAVIPGFYNGRDSVFFMGLFLEEFRRNDEKTEKYKEILNICDCKKSAKRIVWIKISELSNAVTMIQGKWQNYTERFFHPILFL